ncbi:MAG: O-antigen ligase family protein [Verrucomicrobiota bacterium]
MQQATLEAPPLGGARERIDAWCERAILALVLFILVWSPLALGSTRPLEFLVIQGLTVVAVALWAVRLWTQHPFRLLWPPMCWAVLAFVLYALARCPLVPVEYVGRQQLTHVLVYAAWFVVVLNNLTRRESAMIVSLTLIAVGTALSFFAMFQFATHSPNIWGEPRPEQYLPRGSGTFINPNSLAGYLGMLVPLALAYTVMSRLSATIKVLLAYSAVAMLVGIVLTVSRGGLVAASVALVLFCLVLVVQRDFWLPAIVTGCLLLAAGFCFTNQVSSVQRRFAQAFRNDTVEDDRMFYWMGARQLFAGNRLWGVGPGHFDVEFPKVRPTSIQNRPEYAHNDYLNTLCEWGVAGMAIIAAACALLFFGAFKVWRAVRKDHHDLASRPSDRAAFVVGASAGLIGVMLHCAVEFNMQIPATAITAVALMALLTAQWRFATEHFWRNPGRVGKILLTALAAAAAGSLALKGLQRGIEAWWLWRADTETASWEQVLADLKKAHQADPTNAETDIALGENCRLLSLEANPGYEDKAREAIQWFDKAMQLNPFDALAPLRRGMCLDWIGQSQQASPFFDLAARRDPNDSYIATEVGRHYVALREYTMASWWFQRSLNLSWTLFAYEEWQLVESRMGNPLDNAPK